MLYREFKNTGVKISGLGMGCMRLPRLKEDQPDIDYAAGQAMVDYALAHGVNYFDTAYPYHSGKSEPFVGQALKKHSRDSFFLASKMPCWCVKQAGDVERIFNEQLERCQVDYFDFYLCHALSAEHWKTYEEIPILPYLNRMREEGKIRRLGFSFHDSPDVLEMLVGKNKWDFVQIQLNYLDWTGQDAKRQYEILEANGLPCVVMEPVRGGSLASLCPEADGAFKAADPDSSVASWALRFAASLPNVLTVLSGMSNMEQVEDNVKTMTGFRPFSPEDYATVERALELYRKNRTIPCTGCRYCMDCPSGVDIPEVFKVYNRYAVEKNQDAFLADYAALTEEKQSHNCVSCGACLPKCPQGISIPEKLREIAEIAAKH